MSQPVSIKNKPICVVKGSMVLAVPSKNTSAPSKRQRTDARPVELQDLPGLHLQEGGTQGTGDLRSTHLNNKPMQAPAFGLRHPYINPSDGKFECDLKGSHEVEQSLMQ